VIDDQGGKINEKLALYLLSYRLKRYGERIKLHQRRKDGTNCYQGRLHLTGQRAVYLETKRKRSSQEMGE